MTGKIKKTVLVLIAVIAVIIGITFYKYMHKPAVTVEQLKEMGTVIFDKSRAFEMNDLVDHNGKPFTKKNLEGKWTLAYFGYTFCPDICPTTLGQLNQMDKLLKKKYPKMTEKIGYVMVTIDPRRDTVEKLSDYLAYFNRGFVGVVGDHKNIHYLTMQLNIPYTLVIDSSFESNLLDHSANLIIINPMGHYHGFIRPPLDFIKLVEVMKYVDELYENQ